MHYIRKYQNSHINDKQSYKNLDMIHKRCYNTYKRTNKSRKTKLYEVFRGGFK